MFHAGAVVPSSDFLLQLLRVGGGDAGDCPVLCGLTRPDVLFLLVGSKVVELVWLTLLMPRALVPKFEPVP